MGKKTIENYKTNAREEGGVWRQPEEHYGRTEVGFPMQSLVCPMRCPAASGQDGASLSGQGLSHAFFCPDPS